MSRTAPRLQSPLAYAAVGASILAVPASAVAVVGASYPTGSGSPIKAKVKRKRIDYGGEAVVVGDAPSSAAGQTITLQYSPAATGGWRQIASTTVGAGGRFRLAAWLRRSGWLMATAPAQAGAASVGRTGTSSSSTSSSNPQRVAVAAAIQVRRRTLNELYPRPAAVRGALLPAGAGLRVLLQGDRSGRWVTLSAAHTDSHGAFTLHYHPSRLGRLPLRVRFAGDGTNATSSRGAGSVTLYRPSVASWYYDGGTTACGFHAQYGVANLSLPCGTHVSFDYGGRVVQAVVDDRGPYVGGREWDLNQNTAAALGFAGVATVWSSR